MCGNSKNPGVEYPGDTTPAQLKGSGDVNFFAGSGTTAGPDAGQNTGSSNTGPDVGPSDTTGSTHRFGCGV